MSFVHMRRGSFGIGAPAGLWVPSPAVASFGPAAEAAPAHEPATVFVGGTVITMDDSNPAADAIAIAGGKIVAVGARDECWRRPAPDAQRVNLAGRTLDAGIESTPPSNIRFPAACAGEHDVRELRRLQD